MHKYPTTSDVQTEFTTIIQEKMGIFQEITFLPVYGVLKTLQCIEHAAMEIREVKKTKACDEYTKDSIDLIKVTNNL